MTDAGLTLPKTLGAPERTPVNKKIHARWETFQDVDLDLKTKGFTDADRPPTPMPNLTRKQLTDLPNKEYTELHGEYLEWFRYAAEEFTRIKALVLQVKNEMKDIASELRSEMKNQPGKKPTDADIDLAIEMHSRYRELAQLLQRGEQAKMIMETKVDYLERSLRVISRQVELRKIDAGQGEVQHGMPNRGRPPYGGGGYPPVRSPGG
jgi:predicted nucleotidyltransferase